MKKFLSKSLLVGALTGLLFLSPSYKDMVSGKKGVYDNPMEHIANSGFAKLYLDLDKTLDANNKTLADEKSKDLWHTSQIFYRDEMHARFSQQDLELEVIDCFREDPSEFPDIEFTTNGIVNQLIDSNVCKDSLDSWLDLETNEFSAAVSSRMYGLVGFMYDVMSINLGDNILLTEDFTTCYQDLACRETEMGSSSGKYFIDYTVLENNAEAKIDLIYQFNDLNDGLKEVCREGFRLPQDLIDSATYWDCEFHKISYAMIQAKSKKP